MDAERWSTRETLQWIRDYHSPRGGDPHENKHRAAAEALGLMDERDAAVALVREWLTSCSACHGKGTFSYRFVGGEWEMLSCERSVCKESRAFLATLDGAAAEGEGE